MSLVARARAAGHRIRGGATALGVLVLLAPLVTACAQNPSGNTRCVYETGDVATGRCLTECESKCTLELQAGCGSESCVAHCEQGAATLSGACEDASYTYWRCLRMGGLPFVSCSAGGEATFAIPAGTCEPERAAREMACRARSGTAGTGAGAESDAAL